MLVDGKYELHFYEILLVAIEARSVVRPRKAG